MQSKLLELYREELLDNILRLHVCNEWENPEYTTAIVSDLLNTLDRFVIKATSLEELYQCEKMIKLLSGAVNE